MWVGRVELSAGSGGFEWLSLVDEYVRRVSEFYSLEMPGYVQSGYAASIVMVLFLYV